MPSASLCNSCVSTNKIGDAKNASRLQFPSFSKTSSMTKSTTATATAAYGQAVEAFPSIIIGAKGAITPQGSFAEAQAQYLDPDPEAVASLRDGLLKTNMGIVAHYYMDVELQGVLQAVKNSHPDLQNRIGIADSLKMGDLAVQMCDSGTESIICLGVDFMAESVAAIMRKNGYGDTPVYRATSKAIGCSLAESAEREAYRAWLHHESGKTDQPCLHVIYINTSLETKAVSSSIMPTITCTSSNVLQTLLQSSAEIPDIKILYGPDTYMGENLRTLLQVVIESPDWTDEKIKEDLHVSHSNETLRRLRENLVVFPEGNCVVHHMFGSEVVNTVKSKYDDCYMTAHLEVPGEMFEIAMAKSLHGRGVVGSTSDILNFISSKVSEAAANEENEENGLKFILGTEAGMVTSIVQSVQNILETSGNQSITAEIIFPVSSEAVMGVDEQETGMAIVPGTSGGEGCSTAGGCATCPFMKMNDLDAVEDIIELVHQTQLQQDDDAVSARTQLNGHLPPDRLGGKKINGVGAIDLGTESILFMRHFMQNKNMSDDLVRKIKNS